MKVLLLGDLHAGVKSDSPIFMNAQLDFLDTMLDYMVENKIDTIIQLGDSFDKRKNTGHFILDGWEDRFYNRLSDLGIKYHTLVGNHDCYFKSTLTPNSPSLFLSKYDNITVYDEPTEVEIGGVKILMLPWICLDNTPASLDALSKSKALIVAGHLELVGFEMYRGQVSHEGMDAKVFRKFDWVFSGHYHTQSDSGNVHYLGCPYELTWADQGDPRGFHVFDTKTEKLEFIQNLDHMFYRLEYDDKNKGSDYWKTFTSLKLANKYVKLIVINKTDDYQFDRLVDWLYQAGTEDFKIVEFFEDISSDSVEDDELEFEDSISLVNSYIDNMEYSGDKDRLKTLMKSLYVEALEELS